MKSILAISVPFASLQMSLVTLLGFAPANVIGLSVGGGVLGPPLLMASKLQRSFRGSPQTLPVNETVTRKRVSGNDGESYATWKLAT
jgi:hypothetical protein